MMKYLIFIFLSIISLSCSNTQEKKLYNLLEVNRSLQQSNKFLNQSIITYLAEIDLETKEKTQNAALNEACKEIHKLSKEHCSYIDSLRHVIETLSNHDSLMSLDISNINSHVKSLLSNTLISNQIFIEKKSSSSESEGKILEKKLSHSREKCLNIVEGLWENGGIKGTTFSDYYKKDKIIQELNTEMPSLCLDMFYKLKGINGNDWAKYTFEDLTLIELICQLSKIQNDILSMEYYTVTFLNNQIGRLCNFGSSLNLPILFMQAEKTTIKLGQEFEGKFILFFNNTPINFRAFVNSNELEIKENCALYRVSPSKVGIHEFTIDYSVLNSNQSIENYSKNFSIKVIN